MANNRIKIVQGNDLPLCKKLTTIIGGEIVPVPIEQMTDLKVLFGMGQQSKATEIPWTDGTDENHAIIHFRLESTQIAKLGTYNIWIVGKYGVNDVVVSYGSTIEVIEWSNKSTAGEFIYTEEQALDDSIFIPTSMSDEELERLKQLYAEKIEEAEQAKAEAEQAKADYIDKAEQLQGVAKETTSQTILEKVEHITIPDDVARKQDLNPLAKSAELEGLATETQATANKEEILTKIEGIGQYLPQDIATQSMLNALKAAIQGTDNTATLTAIQEAIDNIQIDLSPVAKQGDNPQATNTAILAAIQGGSGGGTATIQNQERMLAALNVTEEMPELVPLTDTEIQDTCDEIWEQVVPNDNANDNANDNDNE